MPAPDPTRIFLALQILIGRIFKRMAGLTPASYRRKFQRIAQIAEPV